MNPKKLTPAQLSEITGLSTRRHQHLAREGHIPGPSGGEYDAFETLSAFVKYQRELLTKKNDDLRVWQKRLTKAKAQMSEELLASYRGDYVLKSEIGPALRNISLNQRATLLRKYEQELAPKLAGRTTLEILAAIKSANDEICRIFSESTAKWAATPPAVSDKPE